MYRLRYSHYEVVLLSFGASACQIDITDTLLLFHKQLNMF
ncbi:hypothetical protein X975_05404, partial [Stegodyphus mimosarum]